MPNEWGVAAAGIVGAVIGGFVGGITPQIVAWYLRPKLKIDYLGDDENIVTAEEPGANGQTIPYLWVRARVRNSGRLRAEKCQVFLTSLHEVRADGSVSARLLKDSKPLQWAGGSRAPIDVPPGVEFYVDLLRISKAESGWDMLFGLFRHQRKGELGSYSGTYQFHLMISGDNAPPQSCTINVDYKRDWHTLRAWQAGQKKQGG
jgi:hypothetical protein